jgi:uncharacterized membrane protein
MNPSNRRASDPTPRTIPPPPMPLLDSDVSTWEHRLPVIVLSLGGLAVATTLTLFQLGVAHDVWEPFFGDGSRRVLTSALSRALPIPDAAVGAAAYLAEAILDSLGGRHRWRTNPWLVVLTGLVAAGLGVAALGLVATQAFLVHAFCTLCLTSALLSLIIATLVAPEVLAALTTLSVGYRSTP